MSEENIHTKIPENSSVLITGGSGLIGRYLTSALLAKGYKVIHLSRRVNQFGKVRVFRWEPGKGILDPIALAGVDIIVHLAGENIGTKRWSERRKAEILSSREGSARLIHDVIEKNRIPVKAFITASAVGYYGSVTSDRIFIEEDPAGIDFLGNTCRLWEESADLFGKSGIRTVKIRSGIVLEKSDSALSKMMLPAKTGFLAQAGSGRQYMPWIHINDLCNIYLKAIEDQRMSGAYNAVSLQHMTHYGFVKTLGLVMNKPVFPFPVPAFFLRLVLGEMSAIVLEGSRVSPEKIIKAGYKFLYTDLHMALKEVLNIHPPDSLS